MRFIKLSAFLFFILPCWMVSCTKADLIKNNSPVDSTTIMGFKDSTQLIKSLTFVLYDSATGDITDSLTYHYFYDTVNKKVLTFLHDASSASDPDYFYIMHFDEKGFLINISANPAYMTQDISIDYTYDNEGIIQSEVVTHDSYTENRVFTKTMLPGGAYMLDGWTMIDDVDTMQYNLRFNANGRLSAYNNYNLKYPNGQRYLDSLVYDSDGNITKHIQTSIDNANDTSVYDLYSFTRDTKGEQFYNFIQVLNHGIASLPVDFGGPFSDPWNFSEQQTKFPPTQYVVHHSDSYGNPFFVTLNSPNQFDGQGRLTKATMFADDIQVIKVVMTITYYK